MTLLFFGFQIFFIFFNHNENFSIHFIGYERKTFISVSFVSIITTWHMHKWEWFCVCFCDLLCFVSVWVCSPIHCFMLLKMEIFILAKKMWHCWIFYSNFLSLFFKWKNHIFPFFASTRKDYWKFEFFIERKKLAMVIDRFWIDFPFESVVINVIFYWI